MQTGDTSGRESAFALDYDYLTKTLSKTEFEARAARILSESPGGRHLLVFVNIDGFREINSKHGYVQGDAILCAIAGRISEMCGDGIVGRVEGDVFVVLFRATDTYRKAEEQLCELNSRVRIPIDGVSVTCTIGGAWFPDEGRDYDALERSGKERLAQAKSMASNRFSLSHPGK